MNDFGSDFYDYASDFRTPSQTREGVFLGKTGSEMSRTGKQTLETGVSGEQMSRKYVLVAGLAVELCQNALYKPQETPQEQFNGLGEYLLGYDNKTAHRALKCLW